MRFSRVLEENSNSELSKIMQTFTQFCSRNPSIENFFRPQENEILLYDFSPKNFPDFSIQLGKTNFPLISFEIKFSIFLISRVEI